MAQEQGDAMSGQTVFIQCWTCGGQAAGKHGIGPSPHGLFGRNSGTAPNSELRREPEGWGKLASLGGAGVS